MQYDPVGQGVHAVSPFKEYVPDAHADEVVSPEQLNPAGQSVQAADPAELISLLLHGVHAPDDRELLLLLDVPALHGRRGSEPPVQLESTEWKQLIANECTYKYNIIFIDT